MHKVYYYGYVSKVLIVYGSELSIYLGQGPREFRPLRTSRSTDLPGPGSGRVGCRVGVLLLYITTYRHKNTKN